MLDRNQKQLISSKWMCSLGSYGRDVACSKIKKMMKILVEKTRNRDNILQYFEAH